MKLIKKMFVLSGTILTIITSTSIAHADTLTVTSQGKVIEKFDITNKIPGDYYLEVLRMGMISYLPWNGEDSVDVVIRDSVLLVNGNAVGFLFGSIDLALLPYPDSIYHLSGQIMDYSYLPGFRNLVYFKPERVSDSCIRYLQGLNQLKILNLSKNQVSDIDLDNLLEIPNLHTLDLSDTDINDEVLEKISGCMSLEKLTFSNTDSNSEGFTVDGLSELTELHNLRELSIADADEIGDDEFPILCNITHLRELEIDGQNVIGDEGLKHISKLTELDVFRIGMDNKGVITDASIEVLVNMESLRKLSIPGANFSDMGWERLRDSLPECDIEFYKGMILITSPPISTSEILEGDRISISFSVSLQQW